MKARGVSREMMRPSRRGTPVRSRQPREVPVTSQPAFANLGVILEDFGATPAYIAKLMTFVVSADSLPGFRTARDEVFADWYPDGEVPAHSLAVVAGLAAPELLIEIEAVVAVPCP